ncbi:putative molybdenum carrier protein [Maribellus maritimus]|uniref:putative molybdenum carrier protein n=1 Tax=Maribellus maritimus TaxID=2870838 RepID=UPI001EEC5013|nr:putative molybdenum carrier protein [Maribellus maritimus]MCG6187975.1 putative molybdenum carrier protein [Maribellus maritimus]
MCQKIISGGQTGVDRGALDACLNNNFSHGGWCPKGRMAEDGRIDIKYKLDETGESNYNSRTYKNVRNSNATLIIVNGDLKGGTLLTQQIATQMKKPVLILFPEKPDAKDSFLKMITFIQNNNVSILNIAGPRKSEWIQGYQYSFQLVSDFIKKIQKLQQNTI